MPRKRIRCRARRTSSRQVIPDADDDRESADRTVTRSAWEAQSMPNPQSFESWDLTIPKVPARSRLYSLTPIGIGTSSVESLTGYVVRLAEAHAVSVGDLVGRELSQHSPVPLPLVHPSHRLRPRRRRSHCFRAGSYSLNGLGETTAIWVKALEIGTCQSGLEFLTLLPFAEILSEIWIFRKSRAWCPECYQTWRQQDLPLYEPLLWSFQAVTWEC